MSIEISQPSFTLKNGISTVITVNLIRSEAYIIPASGTSKYPTSPYLKVVFRKTIGASGTRRRRRRRRRMSGMAMRGMVTKVMTTRVMLEPNHHADNDA